MATGEPATNPALLQPEAQQPQQPPGLSGVPLRANVISDIIAHDHLKGMMNKTTNKGVYRPYMSKLVPRANQSPFGDFPKGFVKKKSKEEDFSIDIYEKSQAASASSNDLWYLIAF